MPDRPIYSEDTREGETDNTVLGAIALVAAVAALFLFGFAFFS